MICTKHPEKEAEGTCVYCGKSFCADCLVDVDGRNYCRDHVSKAMNTPAAPVYQAAPPPTINIVNTNTNTNTATASGGGFGYIHKKKFTALLLCFFLGFFGVHRFYVGKSGTGILYLLTAGLFGIGVLIDFIIILIGGFRDKAGQPLV